MGRLRRNLIGLGLGLGVLAGMDVGSRWLVRGGTFQGYAVPPFGALTNPGQLRWLERMQGPPEARAERLFHFDAELGWTHRASSRSEDGLYTTNSFGARGTREYEPEPPAGVTRVVCYGDSFTMGTDVADDEAYPARLEQLDPGYEAVNLGVGAYGTDQALLRFRRHGLHGAHVVAIGILLENVGRNVNRYRPFWYPPSASCGAKPRFVLRGGELELLPQPFADEAELAAAVRDGSVVGLLGEGDYWYDRPHVPTGRLSMLVRLLYSRLAAHARRPEHIWPDVEGEPFRTSVALLEAFHGEALGAGARAAVVLIFPTRDALEGLLAGREPYWASLTGALEAREVPYLDLARPLAEWAASPAVAGDLDLVYTSKNHLTGPANEVVARTLRAWIERAP